ncbi:calcium-dependent ARF-type GTPase activating protein family [Striga asiatica]|uniref:Calcium-dependent ARF-type GTPase activating protein family n=1 Tax=Striga asiatica TaxID=4170 RepID=A0A5A7PUU2_STRAF|nr:calcium-dependent ARF-type GTPase activating protein family [Striga asiatica]
MNDGMSMLQQVDLTKYQQTLTSLGNKGRIQPSGHQPKSLNILLLNKCVSSYRVHSTCVEEKVMEEVELDQSPVNTNSIQFGNENVHGQMNLSLINNEDLSEKLSPEV